VPISVELGADGIGLFRTEFLYLERSTLPTEEEQYQHALAALRAMDGRGVCFRTLDLGGTSCPRRCASRREQSRAGLALDSLFPVAARCLRLQLRAFYRAAAVGPLRIMFPLISGVAELRTVRELCAGVCAELQRDGLEYNPEVPLA